MEYRVLGPLEVEDQGQPLPLGGAKQRALLALLLLHANANVSSDRLIDGLWGEHPPATATSSLHNHVSRLRKVLHRRDEVLVAKGLGYVLCVAPGELDVERFDELLEAGLDALRTGSAAVAADTLRQALALWRGRAFQCVSFEPFVQPETERLEERRLTALEARLAADLALGRHRGLVGELYSLVAQHPHRERLCEELMLALYRSGRQAESLQVYRAARRTLVEELGVEPGPALRALEQAILRQEPTLAPVPLARAARSNTEMKRGEARACLARRKARRGRWLCRVPGPAAGPS